MKSLKLSLDTIIEEAEKESEVSDLENRIKEMRVKYG
jgi:hypothetical protein